ncbi:MAG: metallophosphoesterase [Lachnospiraceae bacterium]|nr:metallophosphoesterase [Lachnospiraceae bacterium]
MVINTLICVFFVVCLVVIVQSHREFKNFRITDYIISDDEIPDSFNGYRIAVIGDLHNACYGDGNCELIKTLRKEKPDIVILCGDMILCRERARAANMKTADFITDLSREFEVYYGIGNHERGVKDIKDKVGDMWNTYIDRLPDNIRILSDEHTEIENQNEKIYIYGLDIDRYFYKRIKNIPMSGDYLKKKLGDKPDEYTILIAHNPDYFKNYAVWGANLTFSGHIHGGMIRIPGLGGVISPKLRIFPKYDYGYFKYDNKHMIVTGGLGAHFPKIRVNNRPELVMVELRSK